MNMDAITIQDCIDMHEMLGKQTIIRAGHVKGFEKQKREPLGTAIPHDSITN